MSDAGQAYRALELREFASNDNAPRAARRFVADVLAGLGAADRIVADLTLVASELVSNVVEHVGDGLVNVSVGIDDDSDWFVGVQCRDPSNAAYPTASSWVVAEADHPSGRGLGIVRGLSDTIDVEIAGELLTVRCHRRHDRV